MKQVSEWRILTIMYLALSALGALVVTPWWAPAVVLASLIAAGAALIGLLLLALRTFDRRR